MTGKSVALFAVAGLAEIGGAYLVWIGLREGSGMLVVVAGVLALGLYGIFAALQPENEFGRVLAAYGGVFIVGSIVWGMAFDGFEPCLFDLVGAVICLLGAGIIMYAPH
jgi:small multidrug resistance family-3 protein